jgi:hypothetical protein
MKLERCLGFSLMVSLGVLAGAARAEDFIALSLRDAANPLAEQTAVAFLGLTKSLEPVGILPTTGCPGIASGGGSHFWIASVEGQEEAPGNPSPKESHTKIVEYDAARSSVVDQFDYPGQMYGTDLMFASVTRASPIIVSSDKNLWLLVKSFNQETRAYYRLDVLDWTSKTYRVVYEPPKGVLDMARIFPLNEGCLVTYPGRRAVTLVFADGKTLGTDPATETNKNSSAFEVGCSNGNTAWGVNRSGRLIKVKYSKESHTLEKSVVDIHPWQEDKPGLPSHVAFVEAEGLLVIGTGDGNNTKTVRLVDPNSGNVVKKFDLPQAAATAVYRNKKLFAVFNDGAPRLAAFDYDLRMVGQGKPITINGASAQILGMISK